MRRIKTKITNKDLRDMLKGIHKTYPEIVKLEIEEGSEVHIELILKKTK